MALVCIDSHTLIWGIKRLATAGQEEMIERADFLLNSIQVAGHTILVPSPVITETISPFTDDADRQAFLTIIYSRFRIASLDAIASVYAGEMWHSRPNHEADYRALGIDGIKNRFKYDILIAGIAKANRVNTLYCHDRILRNIANEHGVNAVDIPQLPAPIVRPPDLFTGNDNG